MISNIIVIISFIFLNRSSLKCFAAFDSLITCPNTGGTHQPHGISNSDGDCTCTTYPSTVSSLNLQNRWVQVPLCYNVQFPINTDL